MRDLFRAVVTALALFASWPSAAEPTSARNVRTAIAQILIDADVRTIADRQMVRLGVVREATIERRCDLVLRIEPSPEPIVIPLNNLHFVQGDGDAMLDVATQGEPRREFILSVGSDRYQGAMELLSSLARNCGSELVGPPPLISTRSN